MMMQGVSELNKKFDVFSKDITKIQKYYFYGFYISLNKNYIFFKDDIINIDKKYPSLYFVSDNMEGGYILLKTSIYCETSNLEEFNIIFTEWVEMCKKEKKNMEEIIGKYIPKKNNIIKVYFM